MSINAFWRANYQDGVIHEIDPHQHNSIVDILEKSWEKYPDHPSFHNMGTTLTFKQMDDLTQKFASYLQNDLKLQKGDRVALMMPNILQYPIALFGALRAGMIVVNVNPLYTKRELEHQLKDSKAKAIVIFANSAHILSECLGNTEIEHIIVTQIGDLLNFPKNYIVNGVLKYVKKMVPAFSFKNSLNFNSVLKTADASKYQRPVIGLEDIAFLQYTGGTTGVSKGAILTHKNIVSNVLQAYAWMKPANFSDREIILTPLPLYHIFSLTANCILFSSMGALNILITNPRDLKGLCKEMSKWKFSVFTGVNTLFNGLNNFEDFKHLDFSHFKFTLGGGMAVQRHVAEKWKEITGIPLIEAYGLTETSPAVCINPLNAKEFNGTIGLPISSTIVEIKDDHGNTLAHGDVGEICIQGPQVMQGYWNRPEETAKVMTNDGFFRTGDMGTMDDKGFIQIVDRKKDMILVSGFNVYPNEIEEVICEHPKVLECAAVGIPDAKSGEVVKVYVVKKDQSLTSNELQGHCQSNLTGYKKPRMIEFRETLPKSNVGKILRRELREKISA